MGNWSVGRRTGQSLRRGKTDIPRSGSCQRTALHQAGMVASGVQSGSTESGFNQRASRKIESRIQMVENPNEEGDGYKNNSVGSIAIHEAVRTHHRWERQL